MKVKYLQPNLKKIKSTIILRSSEISAASGLHTVPGLLKSSKIAVGHVFTHHLK